MSKKKSFKNCIFVSGAVIAASFVAMGVVAKKKKPSSIYDDKPEEKNLFEGKKVVFVPSEDDVENADGAKGHLEAVGDAEYKGSFYDKCGKRALDIFLSGMGLIVLAPVFAGISLAIKIDDPGPVLFTQKRVGKNKQYFKLHKFRSMKMSTPHDIPTHMLENPDQYITNVGKFLRKHSLDELPQIWDIFIGNMSVIGPRPALWNQDVLTTERDKYNANDIKPGLTGWAQINGRDELEIVDKAKLDGEYVQKESLGFDSKCFLGSVGVFGGDSSVVEGGTGEMKKEALQYTIDSNQIDNLEGKKILFFSPAFFAYENIICDKMREMGAEVTYYDVRSVTSATDRALLKISPEIFKRKSLLYYSKIIEENRDKKFDYILIVKCDMTPVESLKQMREVFPEAKLCLYLWDSVTNIPGVAKKFKYFDTLHSFDPEDCSVYPQLKFRPLFYSDNFAKPIQEKNYQYDVCFLGTIHSDRYKVIKQVQKIATEKNWKSSWFCYLQSKSIYHYYKLTKKEFKDTTQDSFSFEKKTSDEIAAIEDKSRTILDIQHPAQKGLTMRTIEMLGMNKKLITTNASIKNYDFFNPDNICVIDRNNVEIPEEFIQKPFNPVNPDVYKEYSIETWIKTILA